MVLVRDWNDLIFTALVESEDEKTITVRWCLPLGGWSEKSETFPKERIFDLKRESC